MTVSAPRFFATPAALRRWLRTHHATAGHLWVGFHRRATGRTSIAYGEALDEALCVGWIDGVRRRLTAESCTIRLTPRKRDSMWAFSAARPPGYSRMATWWVVSAEKEATRA